MNSKTDDIQGRVHWLTRRLFGRAATDAELNSIQRFLDKQNPIDSADQPSLDGRPQAGPDQAKLWSLICQEFDD